MAKKPLWRQKSFTFLDVTGHGDTEKEAKQNAMIEAERIIHLATVESYDPVLVTYRGETALIFRNWESWQYVVFSQKDWANGKIEAWRLCSYFNNGDKRKTEQIARYDLAQRCWEPGETTADCILDESDAKEFTAWATWQNDWHYARYTLNLSSNESCQYADRQKWGSK